MIILQQRYHDQCEWYQYRTLKDHFFYTTKQDNALFWKREKLSNIEFVYENEIPWDKIDVAIAVTPSWFETVKKHGVPAIMHIDQVPANSEMIEKWQNAVQKNVTLYWSEEERDLWQVGTPILRPHPIDTDVFKGYDGRLPRAITIATRPVKDWGPEMKGHTILQKAYPETDIQVIAGRDTEFPNSKEIMTETEMVFHLAHLRLYFNCAFKLDRTPLEAMGTGMPVLAIRHKNNAYKNYFKHGENIIYAETPEEMITMAKELLQPDKQEYLKDIGARARETIKRYWNPIISASQWNKAFNLAIKTNGDK